MELGINLGYVGLRGQSAVRSAAGPDAGARARADLETMIQAAVLADHLGYRVAWVAEAYGSDAPTIMSWVGARTTAIDVGSAVLQIPARTPAMTAMTAATLDTLTGGRVRIGLGVSGPQVSEGWHGVPFRHPLGRTREYVDIIRQVLRRERLTYAGRHFTLPLPNGPGKALKLTISPVREHIPIYLAAVGPKNLELAGEIADGWLAIFFAPERSERQLEALRRGRRAAGRGTTDDPLSGFDVVPTVPVAVVDDVREGLRRIAPYAALYIGGMGSREQNFYNRLACEMGFEDEAAHIQDLYLTGRHRDAADAVPDEFLDATSLVGPRERIADRLERYRAAGVTTLTVAPYSTTLEEGAELLRIMSELVLGSRR
ncbi:LLM class F420-dependent oxidoreductase [Nostocoides sp. F2B08]|uniref:LLM class F420-dependent oxidoreductase n=1 Tax=Nostocoides sp. F2B08 TaxID=2653936 RepID=UPI001262E7D0|nr:LLM class F420-dependent oxidoreductase [Tetrasphaera sp. F2B08]KAB7742955.1 LLM class F420-dependent oxidoreductase [Tetrasphaera sp. F2B08]